jgi:hypothetical protein
MTVKTISKVEHPLSDLLVAMTICNKASFEDSSLPSAEKKAVPSVQMSVAEDRSGNSSGSKVTKPKKPSKVHIEMPTIEEKSSSKFVSF